jgi:hypothetical protein
MSRKYQCFLNLISLLIFIIIAFLCQLHIQTYKFPDSFSYVLACKELYFDLKLDDHRPFLYSLIYGIPLLFTKNIESIFLWSLVLNILLWFATINVLFKTLQSITTIKTAFYASLVFSICIGNIFIIFHLLTETIFTFTILLTVYYLINYSENKKIKHLIYALSVLILACLIKPLNLGIVLICIIFYYKDILKITKSRYSIALYFSILLFMIQLIGMKLTYGNFTLSYIDSSTYYNYLGTKADCFKNNEVFIQGKNKRVMETSKLSHQEMKSLAQKDISNQLRNNKVNLIKAYLSNLYINSTKGSASVHGCKNINKTSYFGAFQFTFKVISKIQNIFLTQIGILTSLIILYNYKNNTKSILFVAFTILYCIGVSAISTDQGDRFHIILYPLIILQTTNIIIRWKQKFYTL